MYWQNNKSFIGFVGPIVLLLGLLLLVGNTFAENNNRNIDDLWEQLSLEQREQLVNKILQNVSQL